jgi:ABC-type uncharacterized transport system substrate-binding protein
MLKGAKPAELPVQLPTKLELVIALKTAKSIGQTVAEGLVARAVSNSRCAEILLASELYPTGYVFHDS